MKKNRMMRLASVLLVLTLLSTSVISGTFAKYTTSVSSEDKARVAKWGFGTSTIQFEELFKASYTNVANGSDDTAIIAPGTDGSVSFQFLNADTTGPEVAYTFEISTEGSSCADAIKNNSNIKWAIYKAGTPEDSEWGTWDAMINEIESLAGSGTTNVANDGKANYEPGQLPDINGEYTIAWKWTFENNTDGNQTDTDLGNLAVITDQIATLKISVTATQKD